jgi:hypothetical protein
MEPADEPANKESRSETAEDDKLYQAVKAAFLKRLPGTQFEGNAQAQEAVKQFIDACKQQQSPKDIQARARHVVSRLSSDFIPYEDLKEIVIAVIKATTGTSPKYLLDSPSIDYQAVRAVFLERLPGTQFDGNALAQESLGQFIDACVQQQPPKYIQARARHVVSRLSSDFFPDEDLNEIVIAVIKVATGISPKCLFDGPSIDFPVGGGAKVKVLVRERASDVDNILYRHNEVAAFQPHDDAWRMAGAIDAPHGPLLLLSGAPGSGKTTFGIAIARQLAISGKPGACLRLLCSAECLSFIPEHAPHLLDLPLLKSKVPGRAFDMNEFESTYKSVPETHERDLVARHLVLTAIDDVIDVNHRRAPTDERFLVVLLDDAGDCPTFVRAMCSCFRNLQDAISIEFGGGKCYVRLVIAGTGIEGTDHRVGSQPPSILLYHVRPRMTYTE